MSLISEELSIVHILSSMISQCCYKLLYLQITPLGPRWLYDPYGYVDHSVVHANRNEGIQES